MIDGMYDLAWHVKGVDWGGRGGHCCVLVVL